MREIHADALSTAERIRVYTGGGYFPVVTNTHDGAILTVFRAGAGHGGRNGYLVASRSEDAGATWSEPVTVVRTRLWDDRNPAIGVATDGTVVCAYFAAAAHRPDGTSIPGGDRRKPPARYAGLVHSTDHGRTWTEPMLWTDASKWGQWSPYGHMLTLGNGAMMMPIYWDDSHRLYSHDGGRTWGGLAPTCAEVNETAYCVVPGTDGREWIALGRRLQRDNDDEAAMLLLHSTDGGVSWPGRKLFIPGLRYPASMTRLSDGSIFASYGYRDKPEGARCCRILNGGRSWSGTEIVLHDKSPNFDTGYAASVVRDGWVATLFYDAAGGGVYDYADAFCECVRIREEEVLEVLT